MSTEQAELWAKTAAALEARVTAAQPFAVELVVPDLADILPQNSAGEPAIYAYAWDTEDERAIARAVAMDDPGGWADVLIRKACDENGLRLWHVATKHYLEALPLDVLRHVAMAIMTGDPQVDPVDVLERSRNG